MLYSLADCESRTNYSRGGYCWPSFNFSLLLNEVIIPATTAHRLGAYRIFCVLLTFPFFELCHSVSVCINKPNKRNPWQNARNVNKKFRSVPHDNKRTDSFRASRFWIIMSRFEVMSSLHTECTVCIICVISRESIY